MGKLLGNNAIDTLVISPEILGFIAEIDEFKGAWLSLGVLAPDRLNALRHIATIESVGSSTRIEGSALRDSEVERLLNLQSAHIESRDEQEVMGYAEVLRLIIDLSDDIALRENHIKQLHRDLLKYSGKDTGHRGEYKKVDNNVVAFDAAGKEIEVVFETATPFETPTLMEDLVSWANKSMGSSLHPLLVIAVFMVSFLAIHPFTDGNGRLSRLLTTLLLLRSGYSYAQYLSVERLIEKNRGGYYVALRKTQATLRGDNPDWHPWVKYFLQLLVRQCRELKKKIDHEKIMLAKLPDLSFHIVDHARKRPGKLV